MHPLFAWLRFPSTLASFPFSLLSECVSPSPLLACRRLYILCPLLSRRGVSGRQVDFRGAGCEPLATMRSFSFFGCTRLCTCSRWA